MLYDTIDAYVCAYVCATAVVTLKDELASEAAIAALNGKTFHDCVVEVKFNPCNRLLCVGNLPADMADADFRSLIESYGPIERCFLIRNRAGKYGHDLTRLLCLLNMTIIMQRCLLMKLCPASVCSAYC